MTQYEITLALNRIIMEHSEFTTWTVSTPHLIMLIKEAIEKEREECAKVCESSDRYRGEYFAEKIRARGQPQPKKEDTTDAKWIAHCLAASTLPKEFRPKEFK